MSERRSQEPSVHNADNSATSPPTVRAAVEHGRRLLEPRAGADASREALFLLAGVLDVTPGQLALLTDRLLARAEWREYERRLNRRAGGEPLQYVEGRAAFRRLFLRVDRSVMIPRPETEQLVECVLDWCRGRQGLLGLDLGTGSAAIAISLALEGPFESLVAVDISPEALNVARVNATEAGVAGKVDLRQGSLFEPLRPHERFHVIVCNPPYIADDDAGSLPPEVREWEPAVALYAGPTGMEVLGAIVAGAPVHLQVGGLLALELTPRVADATVQRIQAYAVYGEPRVARDLAGHRRFVMAEHVGAH